MGREIVFRCPCCGQIAPIDRLDTEEPYKAEFLVKEFGGKLPFTQTDRLERRGKSRMRGSAKGRIEYSGLTDSEELLHFTEQLRARIINTYNQSI